MDVSGLKKARAEEILRSRKQEASSIVNKLSDRGLILRTAANKVHRPGHQAPRFHHEVPPAPPDDDIEIVDGPNIEQEEIVPEAQEEVAEEAEEEVDEEEVEEENLVVKTPFYASESTPSSSRIRRFQRSGDVFIINDDARDRVLYIIRRSTADKMRIHADVINRLLTFEEAVQPIDTVELSQLIRLSPRQCEAILATANNAEAGKSIKEHVIPVPTNYLLAGNLETFISDAAAAVALPRVSVGKVQIKEFGSNRK